MLNLLCNCVATQLRYLKEKEGHKQQMTVIYFATTEIRYSSCLMKLHNILHMIIA